MPRLCRIADGDRVFFVTLNLAPQAAPLSASERRVVLEQLGRQRASGDFLLFGYVVMPDQLQLLLAPSRSSLLAAMDRLKRCTEQRIAALRHKHGPIWQDRPCDTRLRRVGDFWDKLELIHKSTVQAAHARKAGSWQWSSAAPRAGARMPLVPVDVADLPPEPAAWLHPAPWG
jgi:hypothetical protein